MKFISKLKGFKDAVKKVAYGAKEIASSGKTYVALSGATALNMINSYHDTVGAAVHGAYDNIYQALTGDPSANVPELSPGLTLVFAGAGLAKVAVDDYRTKQTMKKSIRKAEKVNELKDRIHELVCDGYLNGKISGEELSAHIKTELFNSDSDKIFDFFPDADDFKGVNLDKILDTRVAGYMSIYEKGKKAARTEMSKKAPVSAPETYDAKTLTDMGIDIIA